MKKLIFPILLIVMAISSVSAQEEIFYAKLKKEEVPTEVITAITEDIEDGISITDYRALPIEVMEESWFVDYNSDNLNKSYDTYEVSFSGKNVKGRATYDAKGNLIYFVENLKNVLLPRLIQKSIGNNFPGWAVSSDHEIVTIHKQDHQKAYYRVMLTKGKEKKKVVYNGDGNLVKVNREHKIRRPMLYKKGMG